MQTLDVMDSRDSQGGSRQHLSHTSTRAVEAAILHLRDTPFCIARGWLAIELKRLRKKRVAKENAAKVERA